MDTICQIFYWRHKILDAIRAFTGIRSVGGVAEVDEAFFRESFKGNHKKSTTFTMPRKAIKEKLKVVLAVKMKRKKRYLEGTSLRSMCYG